jgi:hypothetical protein
MIDQQAHTVLDDIRNPNRGGEFPHGQLAAVQAVAG